MKTKMSFRVPEELARQIFGYMAEAGLNQTDAITELVKAGIAVKHDGCYTSELARVVRNTIRAELESLRNGAEDRLDEQAYLIESESRKAAAAAYSAMLAVIANPSCSESDEGADVYAAAGAYYLYGLDHDEALEKARERMGSREETHALLWE